jgi:hypothetical protein
MSIEIYNPDGEIVKTLPAGKNKGINRVEWIVRKRPPQVKASSPLLVFRTAFGPTFPPGDYKILIKKGDNRYESKITLRIDQEAGHSQEDMELQIITLNKAYDLLEDISFSDRQVKDLKEKIDRALPQINKSSIKQNLQELSEKLGKIHKELVAKSQNRLSGEKQLAEKVGDIYSGVINYSGKPTESQIERLSLLEDVFLRYRKEIDSILDLRVPSINSELKKLGIEEITFITGEDHGKN